jgi:hypothetical protein
MGDCPRKLVDEMNSRLWVMSRQFGKAQCLLSARAEGGRGLGFHFRATRPGAGGETDAMKQWLAVLRAADAAVRWHAHQRRKGYPASYHRRRTNLPS